MALTHLIHEAYAVHRERGLKFWATHQSVEDTANRLASGHGLVAEVEGAVAGTVTVRGPQPQSPVELYRDASTWTLVQFAVAPAHKGRGLGHALHEEALSLVAAQGGATMAIDTAVPATDLIAKYLRWGYRPCGNCDWRPHTNYLSLLMSRPVRLIQP